MKVLQRKKNKQETDPFQLLAETLHRIPQGFDMDEGGIYLRVLRWIFSAEEASIAYRMKLIPETPEKMAKRLKLEVDYLQKILPIMDVKGQIIGYNNGKYGLMPFVVGIYEEQLDRMDAEFAELAEEYFKATKFTELFGTEPEIFRIVPVNAVIPTELSVFPYQQVKEIVSNARSWGVRECICKKQKELLAQGCNYSKNVCISLSRRENAYDTTTISKPITQIKALQLLKDAEEEGLIHSAMNVEKGHGYICNCCTCCCGVLRGLTEFNQPSAFVKSDYQIEINEDDCIACGICVDRCQFGALTIEDVCKVDLDKCVGCGVCAVTCDEGAMQLVPRSDVKKPTKNMLTWMLKKSWKRKVNPRKAFGFSKSLLKFW